jgi:hypothetical protein
VICPHCGACPLVLMTNPTWIPTAMWGTPVPPPVCSECLARLDAVTVEGVRREEERERCGRVVGVG